MSVGDSAEELVLLHVLERERFARVVLWYFPQLLSKVYFSSFWRRSRVCVFVFHTPAAKSIFNSSLVGARHTSPAAV